jgi:hypothetical protein
MEINLIRNFYIKIVTVFEINISSNYKNQTLFEANVNLHYLF